MFVGRYTKESETTPTAGGPLMTRKRSEAFTIGTYTDDLLVESSASEQE